MRVDARTDSKDPTRGLRAACRHRTAGGAGEYPLQDISPLRKVILLDLLKL